MPAPALSVPSQLQNFQWPLSWQRLYEAPIPNPGLSDPPQAVNCVVDQSPTGPKIRFPVTAADSGAEQLERFNSDPMAYIRASSRDGYWACPSYYRAIGILEASVGTPSTNGFTGIGCGQHLRAAGAAVVNEEHIGLRFSHGAARWEFVVNGKTGAVGSREFIIPLGTEASIGVLSPASSLNVGHAQVYEMWYMPGIGVKVSLNRGKFERSVTDADMGGGTPFANILANAYAINSSLGGFGWYAFTGGSNTSMTYSFFAPYAETFFLRQE